MAARLERKPFRECTGPDTEIQEEARAHLGQDRPKKRSQLEITFRRRGGAGPRVVRAEEEAVTRVTHQGKLGSEIGPGVCAEGSRWGSREWSF